MTPMVAVQYTPDIYMILPSMLFLRSGCLQHGTGRTPKTKLAVCVPGGGHRELSLRPIGRVIMGSISFGHLILLSLSLLTTKPVT